MKVVLLFIFSLFTFLPIYGQSNYTITGTVKDTTGAVVIGANVWLMTERDTLRGTTGESGGFRIGNVKSGSFTLRVTSLGFDKWEQQAEEGGSRDFQVVLRTGMKTLREFVVKGQVPPVTYKKDTVEYDARGFMFSEHDRVADLIKRLPGLEVNADGSISMMGQPVTKIMINGKEFMVSDIKTLTSLIPASLISKIQLIDDYGKMNQMRGTTKGETQKVINLKTDAGVGDIFGGRLSAAYGEEGLYRAEIGFFKFSPRQQYNFSINNSNIGMYTGKGNNTYMDGSLGQKFGEPLQVNVGGQYRTESTSLVSSSEIESITSEGNLHNSIKSEGNSTGKNGSGKMEMQYQPDENNKLLVQVDGNIQESKTVNNVSNIQDGFQRKDQFSFNDIRSRTNGVTGNLFYTHFFKKPGRSIAISGSGKYRNNEMDQDSRNNFRYYEKDTTSYKDSVVHQLINRSNDIYEGKVDLSYIEPIGERNNIEFRYGYSKSLAYNDYSTSMKEADGKISPVDSLSNKFNFNIQQMEGEATWQHNTDNLQYWLGAIVMPYQLAGSGITKGYSLFPVLQFNYKLSKSSFLKMLYKGNNVYPSYNQLAVVPDYSDLQNPVIGNPELKPGKQHLLTMEYKWSKGKNNVFTNFSFSTIKDNITTTVNLVEDAFGTVRQTTGFVNAGGNFSIDNKSGWTRQLGKKSNNVTIKEGVSFSKNQQYYNADLWRVTSLASNLKVEFGINVGIFGTSPNVSYNYSRNAFSGNNTIINIHSLNYYSYNIVNFTKNVALEISLSGQKNYSPMKAFNASSFIMNSGLYCWWFNRKVITSVYVNNVLDNMAPTAQNISANTVSTSNTMVRGRYFMLNFIYDFSKVK
jgi:hypothetical protein